MQFDYFHIMIKVTRVNNSKLWVNTSNLFFSIYPKITNTHIYSHFTYIYSGKKLLRFTHIIYSEFITIYSDLTQIYSVILLVMEDGGCSYAASS